MILRNTLFLLAMFYFLPSAKAMEERDDKNTLSSPKATAPKDDLKEWVLIKEDRQKVTVHMWKSQEGIGDQISFETPNCYMGGLRPVSDVREEGAYHKDGFPLCFAASDLELDQAIQDRKRGDSGTWPRETLTLRLYSESMAFMEKIWKEFLEGSETILLQNTKSKGYILKDVRYVNEKMREDFNRDIAYYKKPYRGILNLYFTNTTMALGLLGKGQMLDENVYYLECRKYFWHELEDRPLPSGLTYYDDAFGKNFYTRVDNPSVECIASDLQEVLKRQMLIKIHKNIENKSYGLDSLSPSHQQEIIKMLDTNETIEKKQETINTYLVELGERYQEQQSWLSLAGWMNTIFYGGEW